LLFLVLHKLLAVLATWSCLLYLSSKGDSFIPPFFNFIVLACGVEVVMGSSRSIMTYVCCHLPRFLSWFDGFIHLVKLYDVKIHNPRRLELLTSSALQSQIKDADNIILLLTETSNWYSHWMLPLFYVNV